MALSINMLADRIERSAMHRGPFFSFQSFLACGAGRAGALPLFAIGTRMMTRCSIVSCAHCTGSAAGAVNSSRTE